MIRGTAGREARAKQRKRATRTLPRLEWMLECALGREANLKQQLKEVRAITFKALYPYKEQ